MVIKDFKELDTKSKHQRIIHYIERDNLQANTINIPSPRKLYIY